jgi:catechol 2,3-dioxygenase-like lactoylglutathione lyase family enzyme
LLGRFLEFSLPVSAIQVSFNFYAKLGLTEAATGETWPHPYGVLSDKRISLGLHQDENLEPTLTFVKPELFQHLGALEHLGIEFEYTRLGNDVFNEVGFRDPSGQAVRLLEARTFSPVKRPDEFSQLGYFSEIALPCPDFESGKKFWEALGFVAMEENEDALPHLTCTSDTVDIGLYDPASIKRPTLRFEVDELARAKQSLATLGFEANAVLPPALRGHALMMVAPEGTPILLTAP